MCYLKRYIADGDIITSRIASARLIDIGFRQTDDAGTRTGDKFGVDQSTYIPDGRRILTAVVDIADVTNATATGNLYVTDVNIAIVETDKKGRPLVHPRS